MATKVGRDYAESEGQEERDLPAPVVEVAGCAVNEEDWRGRGRALVEVEDGEWWGGRELEVGHFIWERFEFIWVWETVWEGGRW